MSNAWPLVPLGEVVLQNREYIDVPEPRNYPKLSVKLYGKGVVLDTPTDGATLKMQRHQLAKAGQVILSEIWGKKGAIGLVPAEGEGALCTSHFFLFDPLPNRVDVRWLRYIFKANYLEQQLNAGARGTTGYAAVRPKHLLVATVPLPPLPEQQRIVARIEGLAAKIDEARSLRRETVEECDALCRSLIFNAPDPMLTPMRELVRLRPTDVLVESDKHYDFAGVYSFGRGIFRGQRKAGTETAYTRLTRLQTGNFVYPKLMAWEGALGVVPPECNECVVSPEFPVFEINTERVLPVVLDVYFRSPAVWPSISGTSTGTNVRRRRLNPKDFLAYLIPLPQKQTQVQLQNVKARVDMLRELQVEAERELNALLPSVLDWAFAGKL